MYKKDALDHFNTQKELARALGISQAAVSKWPELIPEKQALKLARITGGKLLYNPISYESPAVA